MHEAVVSPLSGWENFYLIIGSAAAALTGLMFVVITLVAETEVTGSSQTIAAFGTPTIVHFCAALLVSAILNAPWRGLVHAAVILGVTGAAGMMYVVVIARRARRQTGYKPVLEDWLWHAGLPFVAYAALLVAAVVLDGSPAPVLFVIGTATVLLLFIGIHNAWDTVTYIAVERVQRRREELDAPDRGNG